MDLTLSYIERIKQVDPKLNAFITVTEGLAVQQAERADKELQGGSYLGPLHGIPYGAKDLLATKGIPDHVGSKIFAKQVFDFDSTVISRLRDAGAVLLGKLNMIELAGARDTSLAAHRLPAPRIIPGISAAGPAALPAVREPLWPRAGRVCDRIGNVGLDCHSFGFSAVSRACGPATAE